MTIRLQPDEGVDIQVLNKVPGLDHKHNLQITKLDLSYSETFNQTHLADAYERLLLETMRGIQALFVRRDEVEEKPGSGWTPLPKHGRWTTTRRSRIRRAPGDR